MKHDLDNLALSSSTLPIFQILLTFFQSSHTSTNREAVNLATLREILVRANLRAVSHHFFRLLMWSVCFSVMFDSSVCYERDASYYAYPIWKDSHSIVVFLIPLPLALPGQHTSFVTERFHNLVPSPSNQTLFKATLLNCYFLETFASSRVYC